MIRLALPYPPTSNHNTMAVRGRRISSPKYRAWRSVAEMEALKQVPFAKIKEAHGPYHIAYIAERPDRRRRDLENLPKSLSDALQAAGVIRDDADCMRSTIQWSPVLPVGKDAVVWVEITAV